MFFYIMPCKPHSQRFIAVSTAPTQQTGVHGVLHAPDCHPGPRPQGPGTAGPEERFNVKPNCVSDGPTAGTAQASAIPAAEVLDEVQCPWDTEPERFPAGTAPLCPSLPSL